jgi:hypothetical protein
MIQPPAEPGTGCGNEHGCEGGANGGQQAENEGNGNAPQEGDAYIAAQVVGPGNAVYLPVEDAFHVKF